MYVCMYVLFINQSPKISVEYTFKCLAKLVSVVETNKSRGFIYSIPIGVKKDDDVTSSKRQLWFRRVRMGIIAEIEPI